MYLVFPHVLCSEVTMIQHLMFLIILKWVQKLISMLFPSAAILDDQSDCGRGERLALALARENINNNIEGASQARVEVDVYELQKDSQYETTDTSKPQPLLYVLINFPSGGIGSTSWHLRQKLISFSALCARCAHEWGNRSNWWGMALYSTSAAGANIASMLSKYVNFWPIYTAGSEATLQINDPRE